MTAAQNPIPPTSNCGAADDNRSAADLAAERAGRPIALLDARGMGQAESACGGATGDLAGRFNQYFNHFFNIAKTNGDIDSIAS